MCKKNKFDSNIAYYFDRALGISPGEGGISPHNLNELLQTNTSEEVTSEEVKSNQEQLII